VICFNPLGDTIFAIPAIRALRERFPGARIVILASRLATEVWQRNPYQVKVVMVKDSWALFRKLSGLRGEAYDRVLCFTQMGGLLAKISGTRFSGALSDIRDSNCSSVIQLFLEVLEAAGVCAARGGPSTTEFWVSERCQKAARRLLDLNRYSQRQALIGMHSGGHYFTRKRWPVGNFIELIRLLARDGCRVAIIGGKEDRRSAAAIQSAVPEVINAAGLFRVGETAALLQNCRLFVGNDSGPLHLAVALGLPTLGLFGPTAPEQFYPYDALRHRYVYKCLECSPCYRFGGSILQYLPKCFRPYCMEQISVLEVRERLRELGL
jgi:ADP-heptose:LPS heptosyltransferase